MSWRSAVCLGVAIVVLGGLILAAPVLWLHIDEAAVPPSPDLPAGVEAVDKDVSCGSGGCYRELTLEGPRDQSAADLVAEMGLEVASEECAARSLVDRRQVCRYATVSGDQIRLGVYYDRVR